MPGFELRAPLGRGGFAEVFAADREGECGERVALKIGHTDAPTPKERFRREAEAMARVGPPHTPAIYASGELEDGRPFLAMERLFGETLAERLARAVEPPSAARAAEIGAALLEAIAAAHERGVIHRDLKPENVFFPAARSGADEGRGDRAVLLDFGLTKAAGGPSDHDAGLTRTGVAIGTPEYMAPEQIRADRDAGAAADIYAFGVILFEICTLRPPFLGDVEHGHLALRPQRPSEIVPSAAPLDDLILACLAKEPARRPSDLGAARRILTSAIAAGDEASKGSTQEIAAPASARGKLIADGRQPVVILVAESRGAAPSIIAAITERGGFVVRQRGSRYVAVFAGTDVNDPAGAALGAARALAARHNARAALHLDNVTLRRKDQKAPTVYGACVDKPEAWMPPEPWSGVTLTAELARVTPGEGSAAPDERFVVAASEGASTEGTIERDIPLFGREEVIRSIEASAASALRGGGAGLFTLVGDHGLGKSRLAIEAAAAASRVSPDAHIIALRASSNAATGSAGEVLDLLRRALDAPIEAPANALAFFAEKLGDELAAETAAFVSEALGWSSDGAGGAAAQARTRAIVRAIAEGLRRKAQRGPVAVILDDAQWADDIALDALEYATLDGSSAPLWAFVAAHPRFEQARKGWGSRTQHHSRVSLAPLEEAPAMELAARLLLPAEYPPAATLQRLATWSGGNPFSLREIIRDLKRSGVVRRRTNVGTYYLSTAEIDKLPPSPAWQWLAARQLEALPKELAAFARLCAVLGVSFARSELERVQDAIDRAGDAGTPVDVGYGLNALVERRLLKRDGGDRFSFENALFQDAVYEMLDPTQRERAHRRAFEAWRSRVSPESGDVDALERLARHAGACGEREEAAAAHLRLGEIASARHKHVEADKQFSAALERAREDERQRRMDALFGRGKSRYTMYRAHEATADLAEARGLAIALGDEAKLANILLEEAVALDWVGNYEGSAERVDEARSLIERLNDEGLRARLWVAEGRSHMRKSRMVEAIELLEKAARSAEERADYPTRILALVLLPFAFARAGRLDDAAKRFDEAIALATGEQDWLHLCVAHTNRAGLWMATKSLNRALDDFQRVIPLTREIGNPFLERIATSNMSVILLWDDRVDEAVVMARRADLLERRFSEPPGPLAPVLFALCLLTAGHLDDAERQLAWIEQTCPPPATAASPYAFFRMLRRVLPEMKGGASARSMPDEDWDEILCSTWERLGQDERLDLLYWRARMAIRGRRRSEAEGALARARELLTTSPSWQARFLALEHALAEVQAGAISG